MPNDYFQRNARESLNKLKRQFPGVKDGGFGPVDSSESKTATGEMEYTKYCVVKGEKYKGTGSTPQEAWANALANAVDSNAIVDLYGNRGYSNC